MESELLSLSKADFYEEIIERISKSYKENEEILNKKADCLTILIAVFILETLVVMGSIIVFSAF